MSEEAFRRKALEFRVFFTLFLLFTFLPYSAAEHERQDMNQRAGAALEEILSMEEFRDQELQLHWWSKLIERIFHYLPSETGWMSTALEWLFYIIAALVTVSIFVLIAKRFRRLPSFTTPHSVPIETQRHIDPEAVRMQANEFYRAGDYRRAIRYLYLSLLLYLDKAGLLTYDTGKTDGEYLDEIYGNMADEAERFASLTLFFERKWYGMEESSAGDFQQCEDTFVRLTGLF